MKRDPKPQKPVNSDPIERFAFGSPHTRGDSYSRLCEVFDDFEIGVANVLASGEILYANPKFTMILEPIPNRDIVGRNLRDFVAPPPGSP